MGNFCRENFQGKFSPRKVLNFFLKIVTLRNFSRWAFKIYLHLFKKKQVLTSFQGFSSHSFIRSNYRIGSTGFTSSNKNTNVLKNVHLGIPRSKKFTLFFEEPIIPIST